MRRLGLPSARRTVAKGITLCARLGFDEDEALHMIMGAAADAVVRAAELGDTEAVWLRAVVCEAVGRHGRQRHKTTSPMSGRGQPRGNGT